MGDHRADIKVQFTMHGKTYRMDSYVNWFDDGTGVDARVTDFFRDSAADALARYEAAQQADEYERGAAEREANERAELARLQAKYSGTT